MKPRKPRRKRTAISPGKTRRPARGPAEVTAFLRQLPRAERELALAARDRIRQLVPSATEAVRAGWGLLGFSAPRYFAFLAPAPAAAHAAGELLRLGFEQGVLLEDPWGLLVGAGTQVRFIPLAEVSDLARPGVDALLLQAAELARRPPAPRGRRPGS